jgi:RHS repeat-associated protein
MGGLTSEFTYGTGAKADFITSLTTVYGTTNFQYNDHATDPSLPDRSRWLQATDPLGGLERVEYNERGDIGIPNNLTDPIPCGLYVFNVAMFARDTFFWSKKAMALVSDTCRQTPSGGCNADDYAKAQLFHWLHNTDIDGSYNWSGGIIESQKKPLEARIWYNYPDQSIPSGTPCPSGSSVGAALEGSSNRPSKAGRVLDDGTTQLYQYDYNAAGKIKKATDPLGRVTSYAYAANNIDLLKVFQRNPNGQWHDPDNYNADKIAEYTYDPGDPPHRPHTYIDPAGRTTTYSYDSFGDPLTVENARHEVTTYGYGDGTSGHPLGYLTSITGPAFNGSHPVTGFTYDSTNRVRTVRKDPDGYETTTDYDNLDRPTQIAYPDSTNQQFQYTDIQRGLTLDLTASKDRRGLWTHRHYNALRQMDSITDPLPGHTTQFEWCTCGLLTGIIDANLNMTRFDHDKQSRVISKTFAFGTPQAQRISYVYENTTSRLKSMTDAIGQTTHYEYWKDNDLSEISYTNAIHVTPTVSFVYDANYSRMTSMIDGFGITNYTYYPISLPPVLGAGRLQNVDGPFANDTITYSYDELGRTTGQSINGVSSSIAFDSLGRLGTSDNPLGHFDRTYDGVTPRLQRLSYPDTVRADYTYFGNLNDRRLQTLRNSTGTGRTTLSQFDYTYDPEGQIQTLTKNLSGSQTALGLVSDAADQLTSVGTVNQWFNYSYDNAANRYDVKTYGQIGLQAEKYYTVNNLNQLDTVSTNGGPPVPLYYDGNGSLTNDAAGKTYEWDAANRLIAINYSGTEGRTEIAYDGLGRMKAIGTIDTDIEFSTEIQPPNTSYTQFASDPLSLLGGQYLLSFEGLNPNGGDNTAFVDAVTLNNALVGNGSFEVPALQYGQFVPEPPNATWSFVVSSGVSSNGSGFTYLNPNAPNGTQVAYLQATGAISQTLSLSAGTYTLRFQAAQRARAGNYQPTFQVLRVGLRRVNPVHVSSGKTFVCSGNTIAEERDASGANVKKRFFAEGQQISAVKYYYTRDHLGSVREVADATGKLQGQYDYDAWGNSVVVKGNMQFDFGYTGHYFHQPSGLNLARYRAYSPTLGRWISRDPLGERAGINLYGYVFNNPVKWVDPLGLYFQAGCFGNQDFLQELYGDTDEERRKEDDEERKGLDTLNKVGIEVVSDSVYTGSWWRDYLIGVGITELLNKLIPKYSPPPPPWVPPTLPALPPPIPVPNGIPSSPPANPPTPGPPPPPRFR